MIFPFTLHITNTLSFYSITAIVPLFIVMASIVSFFTIRMTRILELMYGLLPQFPMALDELLLLISESLAKQRGWFGIVSFLLAYLVASKLFTSLYRSLKLVFEADHYKLHYFMVYLIGIPLFILFLFTLQVFSGIIYILLTWILAFPLLKLVLPTIFIEGLLFFSSQLLSWTFLGVLFLLYHVLVPRDSKRMQKSLLVTILTASIFALLNKGFVLFLSEII